MKTKMPFGFRPSFHPSGSGNPRQQGGVVTSQPTHSLYTNQPVVMDANGNLQPVSKVTDEVFGVFAGLEAVMPNGQIKQLGYILAGTPLFSTGSADTNNGSAYADVTNVYVYQDDVIEYTVQANGPLARSAIGQTFNTDITTIGNASAIGQSATMLNKTPIDAQGGQWIVTELANLPDNTWGDAFTVVKVRKNNII